jgi:hypothetical protein
MFGLFFILDVLFLLLLAMGSGLRSSFGAMTDLNSWMTIVVILVLISSLLLRFYFKLKVVSLVIVALPILGMFVWYLWEKRNS